jgi:hypothetical protein
LAAESHTPTNNPKTQTIRKMLDQEGPQITLLWVPSHVGIPGNEKADQAAKEAKDKDISTTERYPPDDLKKWFTKKNFKKRDQRTKMEKRKQRDVRKEAGGRQKGGYKKNAKEKASGNIQTQNRVYEGHSWPQNGRGWQSTMPLLQHRFIRRPHTGNGKKEWKR